MTVCNIAVLCCCETCSSQGCWLMHCWATLANSRHSMLHKKVGAENAARCSSSTWYK